MAEDENQEQDRIDRDQDRSEEAHWKVAEAGAERVGEKQVTPQGYEVPVPEHEDFFGNRRKVSRPEK